MWKWMRRGAAALGSVILVASLWLAWATKSAVIGCHSVDPTGCVVEQASRLDPWDVPLFGAAFLGGVLIGMTLLSRREPRSPFPEDMPEDERWRTFAAG